MLQHDIEARLRSHLTWDAASIGELASMSRLKYWTFAPKATFEPEVLGMLANLSRLQFLSFRDSDLSRDDLLILARLESLQHLDLTECRFDLAAFRLLCDEWARGACPRLTYLCLETTAIGDEELRNIGQIERLQTLVLSHTQISDAGLAQLSTLKKLESLGLCDLKVSEEGMLHLAALPCLNTVGRSSPHDYEQLRIQLFRAQVALQKSNAPLDTAQLRAAEEQLCGFLVEMERWELNAWTRHGKIIRSHKTVPEFTRAFKALDIEVGAERAAIFARYCSRKFQTPVVVYDNLSGMSNLPQLQVPSEWIDFETPTKKKTYFYTEAFVHSVIKRRYTLILEDGEWKVDEIKWWKGGWKRETLR